MTNGPALIAVPVYNFGERLWQSGDGDMLGGHAMSIVGWNEDGFIIRNSWGTDWGSNGYTIFPYIHWGMQWEIWTTVDAESYGIGCKTPIGCIHKFLNWVLDFLGKPI
jgi:hypothetical protein